MTCFILLVIFSRRDTIEKNSTLLFRGNYCFDSIVLYFCWTYEPNRNTRRVVCFINSDSFTTLIPNSVFVSKTKQKPKIIIDKLRGKY